MVEPESAGGQSLNSSNGFCLKVYIGLSWEKSDQFGQVVLSGDGIALLLLQNSAIAPNKKKLALVSYRRRTGSPTVQWKASKLSSS